MKLIDKIGSVLQRKGYQTWSLLPTASVYDALEMMADKGVGALLVISEDGKLVGVISERDYAWKGILKDKHSKETEVQEIMTSPVIFVSPENTVDDCMKIMINHRIRHLPIVEDERVLGVVSIGDLVNWIISNHERTIQQLHSYITGQHPA